MLNAKEIREKAERSYKDFLRSVLRREAFFPFHIKGNKGNANLPLAELYPALKHLIDNSKEKMGFGYTLTYKEVNTRHSGIITLPDEIFFENPQDFLKFIEKENDFLAFRKAADFTKRLTPTLLVWAENNVLKIQKHATDWEQILKIVLFFQQNPKPNCYWRQLPIDVDLAAMETHQTLIGELLEEILLPNQFNINELSFENRYGLRYDEPILRLRFLSEREQTPYGNDISLPFSQLHTLEKSTFEKIFFLTDKSVFLTFPNLDDALAIFWEHPNNLLTKIPFLSSSQCYFIGDIAPKTFEQLAQLREGIPSLYHLQSLLLDKNTFDAFPQHHQTQKITTSTFLSNLNRDEQDFYQFLSQKEDKNTLLQKHISYAFLKKSVLFQ